MDTKIEGLNVHYEKYGTKGKKVVLLHGWGQNTEMMAFIGEHLKEHFVVYNIDFPGFGESQEPGAAWSCEDYTEFLHNFCLKFKIADPIFIGHSFGCRIALRYAYKYGAHRMVLTGAAGIKDKHSLMWYIKTYSYKVAKKLFPEYARRYAEKIGSSDYKDASDLMRQTLVKVVNDDIRDLLKEIAVETLLVFGEHDEATPLQKGRLMERLMPNATLVVFEDDDHYAYINQAIRFNAVLDAFLKRDY